MNIADSPPLLAKAICTILVVEDDMLVRMTVSDSFRDAGFDVVEAFNADEAISILHSGVTIDLMFSDVRMPGSMDGLGLLDYTQERFPALPVIMTSAHLMPSDALARGARHFIPKPYSFAYAITLVERELAETC